MKLHIYGAGQYGIATYYKFKNKGIEADAFIDRDKNKAGYFLDGKYCIEIDTFISKISRDEIVIIAVKSNPHRIRDMLNREGFYNTFLVEEYDKHIGTSNKEETSKIVSDTFFLRQQQLRLCKNIFDNGEEVLENGLKQICMDYVARGANSDENCRG